jgi:GR25 family glycosyltransferase involved in LPS biosynthesis
MDLPIYCLTFRNIAKVTRMQSRFDQVGLKVQFVESIAADDPKIAPDPDTIAVAKTLGRWSKLAWSCMHGHLKIIDLFLESNNTHAIVCEDDVLLHRGIKDELPFIVANFDRLKLDVLLLGYLNPEKISTTTASMPLLLQPFTYHSFEWNVFGTQMYMISRPYAQWLKNTYGVDSGFGQRCLVDANLTSFNADWLITKNGNRALIYPMLAIEESGGGTGYNDDFQTYWHAHCHTNQYNPDNYV